MQKIYSYVGNKDTVELLRDSFKKQLEEHGYHCEVRVTGPVAPWVFEYRKDGASIVALVEDETVGEKWESSVSLETEEMEEDVAAVIAAGVLGLLADLSTRLIESVDDQATRETIVERLTRVLAALK